MEQHIVKSYDRDLAVVLSEVTAMGRLVRTQLMDASVALAKLDCEMAKRIMKRDAEVNGYEVTVDALIESVFARRQPAAGDLRSLIGMERISVDFERMGDEIRIMAGSIERLNGLDVALLETRASLIMALETVARMIDDVIVAVSRRDSTLAREVIARDQAVDEVYRTALRSLILHMMQDPSTVEGALALTWIGRSPLAREVIARDQAVDEVYRTALRSLILHMMQDPSTVEGALALTWIGRSLERTGDHVKNIGEAVVYIVEGADVRHEFYTLHDIGESQAEADESDQK